MKSMSTGRSMARARSPMKIMAPFSTPTSSGGSLGVVGGDGGAELGHPVGQGLGGDHGLAHLGQPPTRHRRSGTLRLHRRNPIGLPLDTILTSCCRTSVALGRSGLTLLPRC